MLLPDDDLPLLRAKLSEALSAGVVSFDTETTSLDMHTLRLVGFSFAYHLDGRMEAHYFPVNPVIGVRGVGLGAALDMLFDDRDLTVVMANAPFDIGVLQVTSDVHAMCRVRDVLVMSWLLDENRRKHNLKLLAHDVLGVDMLELKEVAGKNCNAADADPVELADYSMDDARRTLELHDVFLPQLEEQGLMSAMTKIEEPLYPLLASMKLNGVQIDSEHLEHMRVLCRNHAAMHKERVVRAVGRDLNLNSPQQVGRAFFDEMGLPKLGVTNTGKPSTAEPTMRALSRAGHRVADDLLQYRWYSKVNKTFIDGLTPKSDTGRVYPSLHQIGTVTGRLSSSDPNEQNIVVESTVGVRGLIVPYSDDDLLAVGDYSQIELCLLAQLSGDPALIKAFVDGEDIHAYTARRMGISRTDAKRVNFGVVYGMGPGSLSADLGITYDQAAEYIDGWFGSYPGVLRYKEFVEGHAYRFGYVRTISGRKRRLPDARSGDQGKRGYALRQALNSCVQGSAADLMKLAMRDSYREWGNRPPCRVVMSVHDELVYSVRGDCDAIAGKAKRVMEGCLKLEDVPIRVDMCLTNRWWYAKNGGAKDAPEWLREGCIYRGIT